LKSWGGIEPTEAQAQLEVLAKYHLHFRAAVTFSDWFFAQRSNCFSFERSVGALSSTAVAVLTQFVEFTSSTESLLNRQSHCWLRLG
jgi:hypothetical protein